MNKTQIIERTKRTFKEYAVATVFMYVEGVGKRAEVIKSSDMIIKYIDKNFNDSLVAYKDKNISLKSFEIRGWEKARVSA